MQWNSLLVHSFSDPFLYNRSAPISWPHLSSPSFVLRSSPGDLFHVVIFVFIAVIWISKSKMDHSTIPDKGLSQTDYFMILELFRSL